jgi:dTDP-4-amino-4,6-dideoxygalactose transaminase
LVLTHLYGHVCNIDSIINICSKNNIEILEDAAQSIGAFYKGILVGSFGRASVLSFGYSKILDCGGGGAILTDDKKLYSKMKNLNKSLPRRNKNYYKNLELYKKTYYDIEGIKNKNNYYKLSGYFEKRMSKNFIVSINRRIKENINSQFGYLKKTIEDRMNKAKLYSRYLNRKYFLHPKPNSGSVYWRYTLLAKKRRDELVKFLRENKIDASTWYSGVNKIYNKKTAKLPNTKFVQEKVLNLWLDKKTSKRKIRKTIRLANSFFKK